MVHRNEPRVDSAIHDPSEVYASPMDVVNDVRLAPAEKKRILEGWHLDALRLSESEAENMSGGERARLREVMLALEELERRTSAH
jgi:ABC-type lipopolysaccharide export system ATPase subunit